jgi:chromosome segregation ATPase
MKQIAVELMSNESLIQELREVNRQLAQQAGLMDDIQLRIADINDTFVLKRDFDKLKYYVSKLDDKFVSHEKLVKTVDGLQSDEAELLMHFNSKIREMNTQFSQVVAMRKEMEVLAKDVEKHTEKLYGMCRDISGLKSEILRESSKEVEMLKKNSATEDQLKNTQSTITKQIDILRKECASVKDLKSVAKTSDEKYRDLFRDLASLKRSVGSNKKGFLRF